MPLFVDVVLAIAAVIGTVVAVLQYRGRKEETVRADRAELAQERQAEELAGARAEIAGLADVGREAASDERRAARDALSQQKRQDRAASAALRDQKRRADKEARDRKAHDKKMLDEAKKRRKAEENAVRDARRKK